MVITQVQAFLAILAAGAAIGARRGWHREVISSAVILSSLLFFVNGGDSLLAHLFTGGVSGSLASGAADPPSASTAACTIGLQSAITKVGFPVMALMGYRTAYRYGPAPTMTHHRVTGMIPGLVNGAAIAYYTSHYILPGTQVLVSTPSGFTTTSFLPEVLGLGLVGLLGILFIAGQTRGAKK